MFLDLNIYPTIAVDCLHGLFKIFTCSTTILFQLIFRSLLTPARVTGVWRSSVSVCACVCLSVCPQHRPNSKTNASKVLKLGIGIWPWDILQIIWFWGWKVNQRSRSQGHKVQNIFQALVISKTIEWSTWVCTVSSIAMASIVSLVFGLVWQTIYMLVTCQFLRAR